MENLTLVLEGGAFRSLYTSGVLDVLLKENIEANYVIGVSAGALRREHGLIGFDYLFNDISKEKNVFDYKAFKDSKQTFKAVITNCEKGITEYIDKNSCSEDEILKAVQASSSMPLCSKMVEFQIDIIRQKIILIY